MKNWIVRARDDFKKARIYSLNASENPAQPYQEKYKAKELLEELLMQVSNQHDICQEKQTLISALLHYEIGVICLDTEEPVPGEQHLTTALTLLENFGDISKYSLLPLNIYNQLGILWSVRKELEKALEYLKKAELLYNDVIAERQPVVTLVRLFSSDELSEDLDSNWERDLNKVYAHTLYYLAQVYGYLEDAEQAAMYCYKTLKWQIDHKLSYNPTEWSLNSAVLSQYFATKEEFNVARHLLSCSSFNLSESTEKEDSQEDIYQHTKADVQQCWGKYGLSLLTSSKQRLTDDVPNNTKSSKASSHENPFMLLDCDLSRWESQITDRYILNYEDARAVFLHAHKCFNDAKTYYTLNDFTSDYVGIIRNISELYKNLAFFESDDDRVCKMYKRRADLLEETLNALNVKYYLNVCRQLRFELADIYSEMMDVKVSLKERRSNAGDKKSIQKINTLIERSLHHFLEFITTLEENKMLPGRFEEDLVRPALLAHFYVARLHSKFVVLDPDKQLDNLKASQKYYNFVEEYIKRNADHEHYIKEELDVITEMLKLLPQRILMLANA